MRDWEPIVMLIIMIVIIMIVGSLIILIFLTYTEIKEPPTEIGIIKDFEVSAGGFGHADLCTVELEGGTKQVISGSICSELETGKKLMEREGIYGDEWFFVSD